MAAAKHIQNDRSSERNGDAPVRTRVPYSGIGSIIGEEEVEAVRQALQQDDLCSGRYVQRFESAFASYVGAEHAVAVSNCTAALELATAELALKEDDEIITTPLTFIATVLPVLKRAARVRFADTDPRTLNMDPGSVAKLITRRTRAIYVVHYAGLSVDMDPILQLAQDFGLKIIEDAAHAPGAEYKGRRVGSLGDMTCFSFQSLKNMTTLGDGGMLTTNDAEVAERIRQMRGFGIVHLPDRPTKYGQRGKVPPFYWDVTDYDGELGLNYRMSEPEAAAGLVQLGRLDGMTERRRAIAMAMNDAFTDVPGLTPPLEPPGYRHVYHLYPLLIDEGVLGSKDKFMERMDVVEGVDLWTQYCPIYLHSLFRAQGYLPGLCPVAEGTFLSSLVNLPIYPMLTDDQVSHMIGAVLRTVEDLSVQAPAYAGSTAGAVDRQRMATEP